MFSATCLPSAQLLQIAVEVPQDNKIRSGDGVPLSLSSGKRRLELAASAFLAPPTAGWWWRRGDADTARAGHLP